MVVRKQYADLKQQFDREVAAHSETGAQLISLVNKNNILQTENSDLKVRASPVAACLDIDVPYGTTTSTIFYHALASPGAERLAEGAA